MSQGFGLASQCDQRPADPDMSVREARVRRNRKSKLFERLGVLGLRSKHDSELSVNQQAVGLVSQRLAETGFSAA